MPMGISTSLDANGVFGAGVPGHCDQMTQSTVFIWIAASPLAARYSTMIRFRRRIVSLPVVMHQPGTTA